MWGSGCELGNAGIRHRIPISPGCVWLQISWPAPRAQVEHCLLTGKDVEVSGIGKFCLWLLGTES